MKNNNYIRSMMFVLLAFAFSQSANAGFVKSSDFAFEKESFNHSVLTDTAKAKKVANEVIDKLVAEDYEGVTKKFDESLKKTLSAEKIGEVWSQVLAVAGKYKSREESETQERESNYGAFTICQMAKGKIRIDVWINGSGKVIGLWVNPA